MLQEIQAKNIWNQSLQEILEKLEIAENKFLSVNKSDLSPILKNSAITIRNQKHELIRANMNALTDLLNHRRQTIIQEKEHIINISETHNLNNIDEEYSRLLLDLHVFVDTQIRNTLNNIMNIANNLLYDYDTLFFKKSESSEIHMFESEMMGIISTTYAVVDK